MEQMRLLAAPSRIEKMNPYPTITSPSAHVPLYKLQTSNARPTVSFSCKMMRRLRAPVI